jgi:tRNA nucleotidyltransferase/poly(A) polymerase
VQKAKIKDLFQSHPQWASVEQTVEQLNHRGYIAYVAGGAVRDALIGRTPHDFDIATNATPEDVERIFPNAIGVGRQFGVMVLPFQFADQAFQIEVATFRRDGAYSDGRRPTDVQFSSAQEDALRRDFTVNALFYDLKNDEVVDFVDGLKDLKSRVLRAVGDASLRFEEDKLRILRAVRLSAQLDFEIEDTTRAAIKALAHKVAVVSRERITDELGKLARTKSLRFGFEVLLEVGLFQAIWPKLRFQGESQLLQPFLASLGSATGSIEMVLALIEIFECEYVTKHLSTVPVPLISDEVVGGLVLSREQKKRIDFLVRGRDHLARKEFDGLLDLNHNDGPLLTEMCLALTSVGRFEKGAVSDWINRFLEIADDKGALPEPLVHGDDLLRIGYKPSPRMGEVLKELYMIQINEKIKSREALLVLAARMT